MYEIEAVGEVKQRSSSALEQEDNICPMAEPPRAAPLRSNDVLSTI